MLITSFLAYRTTQKRRRTSEYIQDKTAQSTEVKSLNYSAQKWERWTSYCPAAIKCGRKSPFLCETTRSFVRSTVQTSLWDKALH